MGWGQRDGLEKGWERDDEDDGGGERREGKRNPDEFWTRVLGKTLLDSFAMLASLKLEREAVLGKKSSMGTA